MPDDYAGDSSTTGRIAIGGSTSGVLETQGDVDDFAVSLTAGLYYDFSIAAEINFAPTRRLFNETLTDQNGFVLASKNSVDSIVYRATKTGTLFISVSNNLQNGGYVVSAKLTSPPDPVYRFFDSTSGSQFLTASTTERNDVLKTRPDLVSEGVGFNTAYTFPASSPVYRFFDTHSGTHFFTSSVNESETIKATRSDLISEGVRFYEYSTQQRDTAAVYRFFDTNQGTHFFTASASERTTILSTRPDLVSEGIAFYSPN